MLLSFTPCGRETNALIILAKMGASSDPELSIHLSAPVEMNDLLRNDAWGIFFPRGLFLFASLGFFPVLFFSLVKKKKKTCR